MDCVCAYIYIILGCIHKLHTYGSKYTHQRAQGNTTGECLSPGEDSSFFIRDFFSHYSRVSVLSPDNKQVLAI